MTDILDSIKRDEFAHAKWWYRASAATQWTIAAAGFYSIVAHSSSSLPVVVVGFVAPMLSFIFKEIGGRYYSHGEKVRRLHLLQEGLGLAPSEHDLLDIHAKRPSRKDTEPTPINGYFDQAGEKGPRRLFFLLQQSSFWTGHLAKYTSWIHYGVAVAGLVGAALLALIALQLGAQNEGSLGVDYARLFSSLMVFFLSGVMMTSARSYQSLADAADKTCQRAAELRTKEIDDIAIYKSIGSYDAALAKALPIPSYVYKLFQAKLEASWQAVMSRPSADPK